MYMQCIWFNIYLSHELRWALGSSGTWGDDDLDFHLDDFYYAILGEDTPICEEGFDNSWADETLNWWKV